MTTLPAGYDFLGKLGDDLRDLIGLDTLVYELVQNADDAPRANEMTFDVSEDALRVSNNGVFSDCGRQEESLDCPGIDDGSGMLVRCDFHSLRLLAGQAKRAKRGTTGAFGIGFTSVFQITDCPELVTGGRHWVLRYDRPEKDRIDVCGGCELDHSAPGTTFILPWARDPTSPIRLGLKMDPIAPDVPRRFAETASDVSPAAVVFLRKLQRVTLMRDGAVVSVAERADSGSTRRVTAPKRADVYWMGGGSFATEIETLRQSSAAFTDDVREAQVEVAIPLVEPKERLPLHVVLPTREETELSLRVSAPFFPFQNRKSIRFETDAESEWNRAAINASAKVVRDHLGTLVETLPPPRLWSLIRSMFRTSEQAGSGAVDGCFASFWSAFLEVVDNVSTVSTTSGVIVKPSAATLVPRSLEFSDALLRQFGFAVVDPAVRPYVSDLAEALGVAWVSTESVARAITASGLDEETLFTELPPMVAKPEDRSVLYRLLNRLLDRPTRVDDGNRVPVLDGAAVIPTVQGSLAPPERVALEPSRVVELFREMPTLLFADEDALRETPALRTVLGRLSAVKAIDVLAALTSDEVRAFAEAVDTRALIRWFEEHRAELNEADRRRLAELSIFPSFAGGYLPLTRMQLPGDFNGDPLGVVTLLDLGTLEPFRAFLEDDLDATTLDFHVYATNILPEAFSDPGFTPPPDALDALLETLDGARATIAEDKQVRVALGLLEIISCRDGVRRRATKSYFDSEVVRTVLGESQVVAITNGRLARLRGTLDLLGVHHAPDARDVIDAIGRIVAETKSPERRAQVRAIVDFLAPMFIRRSDEGSSQLDLRLQSEYEELRELKWLPVADEDAWAIPRELYRTEFRQAFSSAGRFIDLPLRVQEGAADFLRYLWVGYRPSAEEVVTHIENCRRAGSSVHVAAYRFLNDADDDAYVRLRGFESICLAESTPRFVSPDEVVSGPHSLGRYLVELPEELKVLTSLVEGLEIPSAPNDVRAAAVLEALADEYADVDRPISAQRDALAILRECWRILEQERERASRAQQPDEETLDQYDGWLQRTLGGLHCWPDGKERLKPPITLLIDDMHQLAERFPFEQADRLIQFPREAPTALPAAGVRTLSSIVRTELREAANSRNEHRIANLLGERRELVARVVAANIVTGDSVDGALARLDAIRIYEADTLIVEHALLLDDDVFPLDPEPVRAYLDRDADALYVLAGGQLPALEVAVQLTPLLCPSSRADAVAPALKLVLAATAPDEAKRDLDAFGFANLDREVAERVSSEPALVAADDEDVEDRETDDQANAVDEEPGPNDGQPWPPASETDDGAFEGEADTDTHVNGLGELDPEADSTPGTTRASTQDEDERDLDAPPRSGEPPRHGYPSPRQPGASPPRTRPTPPPATSTPRRGVDTTPWRTWISGRKGASDEAREEHPERIAARREIEQAGIARVIQYERDHGREATAMPPNNRGFDIESGKGPGRPVQREIEVKSLGSSWEAEWARGGNPPQLTRPQFLESVENGRRWLYVVENALDDEAWGIYPIQQVGLKTTNFLLDDGWKEAADQPDAPGIDYSVPMANLPDVGDRTWPLDEADLDTDIPFVPWAELVSFLATPEADRVPPRWYAAPAEVGAADLATQQCDHSMSARAPFGSILTIRNLNGDFTDGQVVLADVSEGVGNDPRLVVRRAFHESDTDGVIVGVLLEAELPTAEQYAFPLDEAAARLRGYVICVDPE